MTHPRGRQSIGINQLPNSGTNYPFVNPSTDIQHLFGDLYLSFEDDNCILQFPLKVSWLYGFGTNTVTPPSGYPTPVNDYEVIISDINDVVVFDSTQSTNFDSVDWPSTNPRLKILEWKSSDVVCRLTTHTEWSASDTASGLDRTYDDYIIPENGEIDSRTLNKLPRRVKSLRVGITQLKSSAVVFDSGFNIDWQESDTTTTTGRATKQATISAIPGVGLGTVPGCTETEPVLRKFAGVTADPSGNILLDAEGCLKVQRPVNLTSGDPREFQYAATGLSSEEAQSALELGNNCGPCCDCDYFVRTYKGLKRQWDLWQLFADQAEETRDTHKENVDRWTKERDCRESNPLNAIILPETECKLSLGALYCNTNKCCAIPLIIRFTFQYFRGDQAVTPTAVTCNAAEIDGSPHRRKGLPVSQGEEYSLAGSYPVYESLFEYADPQDTSRVSFRLCFPDCAIGDNVKLWVSIHHPDFESECTSRVVTVPSEIETIWAASSNGSPVYPTRALKETSLVPLNTLSAYCESCKCT